MVNNMNGGWAHDRKRITVMEFFHEVPNPCHWSYGAAKLGSNDHGNKGRNPCSRTE